MAFAKDFIWCAGGASAQQDGGYLDGGKGLSVWDVPFIDGHIRNGEDNKVACDHFHRWRDDLKLLKELGVNTYRFSISPARIYPKNEFTVNEQGVKFYVELVAELEKLGIRPMCTLYHWDMPMWLYKKGGWKSSLATEWFERYTKTIVDAISDKVEYWITFNEPQCFIAMGYGTGEHSPFEKAKYFGKREPIGAPRTTMGWTMTPECMYWSAKFFYKRYGLPIMITENVFGRKGWNRLH